MINETRLTEIWRSYIEQIHKLNPNATIGTAKAMADDKVDLHRRLSEAESVVLVLIREYMMVDDNGNYPSHVKAQIESYPRLQWAIEKAGMMHAGVACSPFSGGFPKFDESIDAAIQRSKK